MIDSVEVLIESLGWAGLQNPKQIRIPLDLSPTGEKLYKRMLHNGKQSLDKLAKAEGLSISETAIVLMELEMKKVVRPLPGKYFELR